MLKAVLIAFLPILVFSGEGSMFLSSFNTPSSRPSGILEKMVVESGSISFDLDMGKLTGTSPDAARPDSLRFDVGADSFYIILVYNGELRGPLPSSLRIAPIASAYLPSRLADSYNRLILESLGWGSRYSMVVRDAESGFVFFNVEGYEFEYDGVQKVFNIKGGRLLISDEFAKEMGRPADVGVIVGELKLSSKARAIEVQEIANGEVESSVLPAGAGMRPDDGSVPGPDVIVGDVNGLAQFGSANNGFVGLALGTDSCNAGTVNLNWHATPSNDHPVIPQNLYRMTGGSDNTERFEQIGQSSVKHAFYALTDNICGFGCNGVGASWLGSGCSDPYEASLNAGPSLGSRAWVNPFTGFFPRGDSQTPPNNHAGHTHTGTSHRILTKISDLDTSLNQGATYYAEGQYVSPHEYAWCEANPGQCNMNNNVSYRRYSVIGTSSPFVFIAQGSTERMKPAIYAWTGATMVDFQPDAVNDGVGVLGYKVTQKSPGLWHYEYAVYNQNLDRAIQSILIPTGNGVTVTNIGFSAPPQHPGWTGDGTMGNLGFSSSPWQQSLTPTAVSWNSETLAQNENANTIRWGTLYNFRFDANRPPGAAMATIGFAKTGNPIQLRIEAPLALPVSVSGRVVTPSGLAIRNVIVKMTDENGSVVTATTNSFGLYSFENITPGKTYTLSAASKRYRFAPKVVSINSNLTDVDFAGLE